MNARAPYFTEASRAWRTNPCFVGQSTLLAANVAFPSRNEMPNLQPDQEGGAQGRAPFFDRAMEWRVEKSREPLRHGVAVSGKALFFGSVSFWPEKEMNSAASADESFAVSTRSVLPNAMVRCVASFISSDGRHCVHGVNANGEADTKGERRRRESKKRTKEKRFPRCSNPMAELPSRFFNSPSRPGRKTTQVPVRRPADMDGDAAFLCMKTAQNQKQEGAQPQPQPQKPKRAQAQMFAP